MVRKKLGIAERLGQGHDWDGLFFSLLLKMCNIEACRKSKTHSETNRLLGWEKRFVVSGTNYLGR